VLSLEQVRVLESRVEKAVGLIASLRAENSSLRHGLQTAEQRVSELEALIAEFQKDQARIESGILEALRKLDSFEDAVHASHAPANAVAPTRVEPAQDAAQDGNASGNATSAGEGKESGSPATASPDLDIF